MSRAPPGSSSRRLHSSVRRLSLWQRLNDPKRAGEKEPGYIDGASILLDLHVSISQEHTNKPNGVSAFLNIYGTTACPLAEGPLSGLRRVSFAERPSEAVLR